MLSRNAVYSSNARTARKSRSLAPSTFDAFQVLPPSMVRSQVPPLPLAQATFSLTAHTPRSEAVVPDSCGCHDCPKIATALIANTKNRMTYCDHFLSAADFQANPPTIAMVASPPPTTLITGPNHAAVQPDSTAPS